MPDTSNEQVDAFKKETSFFTKEQKESLGKGFSTICVTDRKCEKCIFYITASKVEKIPKEGQCPFHYKQYIRDYLFGFFLDGKYGEAKEL